MNEYIDRWGLLTKAAKIQPEERTWKSLHELIETYPNADKEIGDLIEEKKAIEKEMVHWYQLAKSYERTILRLVTALTREDDDVEE